MVAKVRIMGAAVGTIMAVIITAHMINMTAKSTAPQGRTWAEAILIPISMESTLMLRCISQAR
jgi:hypothetical protein